jgi:hypothetical protein
MKTTTEADRPTIPCPAPAPASAERKSANRLRAAAADVLSGRLSLADADRMFAAVAS